jgi:GNAT superfamily N-acetyltransferase
MNKEDYHISTDKSMLDLQLIHNYLSGESYWAKGMPLETMKRSIQNSICFGVYLDDQQVGFARIISDCATFAYLADVFIIQDHRGKGLSKMLMEYIMNLPELQGLRRWVLGTAHAHGLYAQYGFTPLAKPERMMEKHNHDVYKNI